MIATFTFIYQCKRCGALRFKDESMNFCKCGGRYELIYDANRPGDFPDVKVEDGIAYFNVRCAYGHWFFAPYVGGEILYDLCPHCEPVEHDDPVDIDIYDAMVLDEHQRSNIPYHKDPDTGEPVYDGQPF